MAISNEDIFRHPLIVQSLTSSEQEALSEGLQTSLSQLVSIGRMGE